MTHKERVPFMPRPPNTGDEEPKWPWFLFIGLFAGVCFVFTSCVAKVMNPDSDVILFSFLGWVFGLIGRLPPLLAVFVILAPFFLLHPATLNALAMNRAENKDAEQLVRDGVFPTKRAAKRAIREHQARGTR